MKEQNGALRSCEGLKNLWFNHGGSFTRNVNAFPPPIFRVFFSGEFWDFFPFEFLENPNPNLLFQTLWRTKQTCHHIKVFASLLPLDKGLGTREKGLLWPFQSLVVLKAIPTNSDSFHLDYRIQWNGRPKVPLTLYHHLSGWLVHQYVSLNHRHSIIHHN